MELITIKIYIKSKRKAIEVEMNKRQFENFTLSLESNTKFLDIGENLFINKNEITIVEIE